MEAELLKRITTNPGIFNGKPIIRGMRFKVADVLGYLAAGMPAQEILNDFPFLEADDIKAALLYASEKIDHSLIILNLNAA
ncbi:MAG: DUF433 domain-containing protein [Ferruginibacter sp.]